MSDAERPLSRWSQRKAAARRGEVVDDDAVAPVPDVQAAAPEPAAPAAEPEAEAQTPALPSIDELDAQSDYTVFMGKNVPEALRRAALRKLWTSDPVLANLDGLNDYDDDYNLVTTVVGAVQSAWQAGRGYVDEAEKKLTQINETPGDGGSAAADSADEPAQAGDAADDDAVSENDAAPPESVDALRQSADVVSEDVAAESAKESDK